MALVIPVRSYSVAVPLSTATTFHSAQFPMSGLNVVFGNVVTTLLDGLAFGTSGNVFMCTIQTSNDGMTWTDVITNPTNLSQLNGGAEPFRSSDIVGGVLARLKFVVNTGSGGSPAAGTLEIHFDANTTIA